MIEFLENEVLGLIAVGACCLILIFILRGQSGPIVIKLLKGTIRGLILFAALYYLFDVILLWSFIASLLLMLLTVLTAKIKI